MRGDRGAAAVETGLVLTVLLALTGFAAPLPVALLEKTRLERAAGQAVRWATSAPAGVRGFPRGGSPALLQAEVERALEDAGSRVTGATATLREDRPAPQCPLRVSRTVEVTATVDLGPLSALLDGVGGGLGPKTITARATACDE